jgi:antirestriction protein
LQACTASPGFLAEPALASRTLNRRMGLQQGDEPRHFFIERKAAIALSTKPGRPRRAIVKYLSIMKNLENAPKIYVGTYGQYNNGSLFGKWFDLTDYADLKEFLQDCHEFHRNEFDPELMFQDWENIPDFLISECSVHKDAFAYFEARSEMDEETAEAFEIYCKQINYWPSNGYELEDQIESFRESYQGFFGGCGKDATLEYTYQYVEDTGLLSGVPQALERYFNYEAFAKDLFLEGYSEHEGHIFTDY